MNQRHAKRRVAALFTTSIFLSTASLQGAGFALQEHSISGLGVGFTSGAAAGSDNSSMFFNPATLTLFPDPQVTAGIHFIMPEAEFRNEGTLSGYVPGVMPGVPTQGPNDTSDKSAAVPNIYYSQGINENLFLGLGISTPYGLATSYKDGWVGRYVALETDLQTINTNLALAYKVSDQFSIGIGASLMYGDASLSNAVNYGLIYLNNLNQGTIPASEQTLALAQDVQANLGRTKYDGLCELEGDDIGYGFNMGMLFTPTESTRIGLHYRSKVKLELDGRAKFTVGALEAFFGSMFINQGGKVDIELPDTAQVSIHQQVTPEWAVMADVFHTWWSKFDELNIRYETGFPPNTVIPEKWEDTWRLSVGTTYQLNERVELRGGLVWDESGVPSDTYRSPRIPDEERIWISIGIGYAINENLRLDAGFVRIFVEDPVIDNPTHTSGEYLKGTIDATVNLISIGASWMF